MAERSFAREVEDLKLGDGEVFRGEGILAITKALLQSGVAYVGGYQGAPISHLMDVLADAKDVLDELGVHFETSRHRGRRRGDAGGVGDVSDARRGDLEIDRRHQCRRPTRCRTSSSGGVTGGALIIIGEDYGEGSSIMQERTPRLRDEVADLAARSAARICRRIVRDGRRGLRAVGGVATRR